MAGRDGEGKAFIPSARRQDKTVDDALRTMERLAMWLDTAKRENAWQQTFDPVQAAMLHGMLVHLRQEIDALIALGGTELEEVVRMIRALAMENHDGAST